MIIVADIKQLLYLWLLDDSFGLDLEDRLRDVKELSFNQRLLVSSTRSLHKLNKRFQTRDRVVKEALALDLLMTVHL